MVFFRKKHFLTELIQLDAIIMQIQESSTFFSKHQVSPVDHPLSTQGRFNRLSYIAWFGFLHLIFTIALLALGLVFGIVNLHSLQFSQHAINSISGLGQFTYLALSCLYLYGMMVVIIRRLHDRNKSGWFILLLLIPIVQFLMLLYLLLARGCNRANRFGHPRPSTFIEKLMAWLMLVGFVISLVSSISVVSFMLGAGEIENPTTIIEKGTKYF